jgi:diguanylate cyclase (GGDEF)-like protein
MNRFDTTTIGMNSTSVPRIGLMIIPSDPFWIQIYHSIVRANEDIGDDLITLHPAGKMNQIDRFAPETIVDQVIAHSLDALITTQIPDEILSGLLEHGLPVLCLAEVIHLSHPRLTLFSEMDEGGAIAAEYLGQRLDGRGHVMIVTAGKLKISSVGQSRLRGFMNGMQQFPEIQVDHIPCSWDYQDTFNEMLRVFENYQKPIDAVFGISDSIMFAVRDAGIKTGKLPPQAVLIGLNGDPQALVAVAEKTFQATVDVGIEQVGGTALKFAHQAAYGKPIPGRIPFAYQLVTYENVATVAARKLSILADIYNHLVGFDRQREHDRLVQFEAAVEISHQIGSLLNSEQISAVISTAVRKGFGYEWVRILRFAELKKELSDYAGELSPASRQMPIAEDQLLYTVLANNAPIIIPDTQTSFRWHTGAEWSQVRSRAILPVRVGEHVIGLLDLQSAKPILQPSFEITGLEMLATQVGIAMQNADLYQESLRAREQAEQLASENARLYGELMEISVQDELTSALNRRGLMDRGRYELLHAYRLKYQVGILMVDVDDFKKINDTYGHAVGDEVLCAIVKLCQQNIRETDILGRYGGDEFVIALPGCDLEDTYQKEKCLRDSVEQLRFSAGADFFGVTISVGAATCGPEKLELEELLQKADQALYISKQAGKNIVSCDT